jgi:cell division protein FtsL
MASFKKLLTSVRPTKATRPAPMRPYRVAAALPMELKPQSEPALVADEAPEAVRVRAERDRSARVQQQWVISFVVIIGMLALLAGLYLNITATASIAGRQIQSLEAEITSNEQVNADLETRIATLMSNAVLEQRAVSLGYVPAERTTLQYMVVPGYFPPQPINMVSAAAPNQVISASPEFNETLIDWITKQIEIASIPLAGATTK